MTPRAHQRVLAAGLRRRSAWRRRPRGRSSRKKPNILVIWGDDIGIHNISAYNLGVMGYQTPNIDRIAKEGALFTDAYAQQSCTAGRASFILGQHPFRTGLLTIGMPGSPQGIPDWAPTIADLLKAQGYATGQFGKNHLGDRDTHLPTVHGFDEFLGNLYHLNAEEEPETYYYPKDPEFKKKYGPRGVLHTWSRRQGRAEDRGHRPAHAGAHADRRPGDLRRRERSSSTARSRTSKPFFVWFNTTRMHVWTHLKQVGRRAHRHRPLSRRHGRARRHGRRLLKQLDDLGIADNTIVVYGTDNGAETGTWPDGGTTPFHGEKGTTWEGGFRVPMLVRWPGVIKPGTIINDIFSQEDWLPTLLAAAGEPDIVEKLKKGYKANGKTWKVHLDGYNFLPYFKGEAKKGPREEIFYFGQGGELNAVRWNDWKVHFAVDEWQHRDGRPRRARLAGDRQPAGRPVREGAARVRAVPPLVCGQHLALRAGAAEAQGVPRDAAGVSVPAGQQPERRGHQLQLAAGDAGDEAPEGAGNLSRRRTTDRRVTDERMGTARRTLTDTTEGRPTMRRNAVCGTFGCALVAVAMFVGRPVDCGSQTEPPTKQSSMGQQAQGFSFAVYGDSRSMMYLPYKAEQEAEARDLMVEMFELVLPEKVAAEVDQKGCQTHLRPGHP